MNPVDWFNLNNEWKNIIDPPKYRLHQIDNKTYSCKPNGYDFQIVGHMLTVMDKNDFKLPLGDSYSKFEWYTMWHYAGNWNAHIADIEYLRSQEDSIPFIRVGTDYYKKIIKKDTWNKNREELNVWNAQTIKEDYGKEYLKRIPKFDSFIMEPDNINYKRVINGNYNRYSPFVHEVNKCDSVDYFPKIETVLRHVFKDQYEIGLNYIKILYEFPKQKLPVLCLVSEERKTGKTTFINFLNMLFGDNFVSISPDDIGRQFNISYATKNIIAIDESLIEKQSSGEKIKRIVTEKNMLVNPKHVNPYTIPFFGKMIMATNKERDFMRIDKEEIRFWIRKISQLKDEVVDIEDKMMNEIPYFLGYIKHLPPVKIKTRMVFTQEEIQNEYLTNVKEESRSGLYKDIKMKLYDYFSENEELDTIYARANDIKNFWYQRDNSIGAPYIQKVLSQEFKINPEKKRRTPTFNNSVITISVQGRFYKFKREDYC